MIRMVLKGLGQLVVETLPDEPEAHSQGPETQHPKTQNPDGRVPMRVLACAVCRTDAKMWEQGHRDLVFPRVPGHEMVVCNAKGERFLVWPGSSCGTCPYCRAGRENLCDEMKITGFHTDGGFAHRAMLPAQSLIPIPETLDTHAGCFAEPVACVINALAKLPLERETRLLIFGGGTMGLITALYARYLGLVPLILEKDRVKLERIAPLLTAWGIEGVQETLESRFPLVINACPDYIAFCQAVTKVDKGGHISFFSGITKNETLETNLLNLIHYREASISGGYGMKKADMELAVPFLVSHGRQLLQLVEAVVAPEQAPDLMPRVLSGQHLKYILDFTRSGPEPAATPEAPANGSNTIGPNTPGLKAIGLEIRETDESPDGRRNQPESKLAALAEASPALFSVVTGIPELGREIEVAARAKMDDKSKPLGALGRLEPLAVTLCKVQQSLTPGVDRKALFVFAGDHGVTEEGVSAFPAEVTGQMVENFLNGGAAINVLCRRLGIRLKVVDTGVRKDFAPHPDLIRAKVAPGTRNMALEPAMTEAQAIQALEAGMHAFLSVHRERPVDILGLGEMGIGNTTSASAIISAVTGIPPARTTGRGTGVDNQGLTHKREVIERILNFHRPDPENPMEILSTVGGFEIAGIAGAALAAASQGCAVVLDGVISTAAGLIAYLLNPEIKNYFIAGHQSVEIAHTAALERMGLDPVVDLAMRLGEGTGAALAMDLADTACCLMCEMASFDEAKISRKPD